MGILRNLLVALLLACAARPASAQNPQAPVDVQFSLFYRILSYDRSLARRIEDSTLTVGIVFQGRSRASVLARDEALEQWPPRSSGFRVQFVTIDLDAEADFMAIASASGCDVLYITPLRARSVADIASAARARRILTLTGVTAYVDNGLAVGVGVSGDRPTILINRNAALDQGADFSAQLLRLATIR